jgi:hypothetical protein
MLRLRLRRVAAALVPRCRRSNVVADVPASRLRLLLLLSVFWRCQALAAVDATQQTVVELVTTCGLVVASSGGRRRRGRTRIGTVVEQLPKRGICEQIATATASLSIHSRRRERTGGVLACLRGTRSTVAVIRRESCVIS